MIISIALRELRSMFLSPLAWTVLAVTQLVLAWSFFTQIDFFFNIQSQLATVPNAPGVTDLVVMPTFEVASIILLMVTPLLTMRLISEERRNGSIALLLSSPISMTRDRTGKIYWYRFVHADIRSYDQPDAAVPADGHRARSWQTGRRYVCTDAAAVRILCSRPVPVIVNQQPRGCSDQLVRASAAAMDNQQQRRRCFEHTQPVVTAESFRAHAARPDQYR